MNKIDYFTVECLDDYDFNQYIFNDIDEIVSYFTNDIHCRRINRSTLDIAISKLTPDAPLIQIDMYCDVVLEGRSLDDWDENIELLKFEIEAFYEIA